MFVILTPKFDQNHNPQVQTLQPKEVKFDSEFNEVKYPKLKNHKNNVFI